MWVYRSEMESGNDRRAGQWQFDEVAVSESVVLEDCVKNLLRRLEVFPYKENEIHDGDLRVISISNEEATGKTALVRSVYGRVDVKRWFAHRAWICVQNDSSGRDVLANMLRQISTHDFEDVDLANETQLSFRLCEYFGEQRYLVVLDNINDVEFTAKLLRHLIDCSNGSRVIITTRNANLPKHIDPWSEPINFLPLTDENRKLLLLPRSRLNDSKPDQHDPPDARSNLVQRILSWSSLTPAGIRLLGGLLSVTWESKELFEAIRCRLEKNDNPSLENVLSLCFEDISPSLQSCIMYTCLFPREYDIPTRRLLRLWLAERLTPAFKNGIKDAKECFKELMHRNMIHVASHAKGHVFAKTCRLPGFIYDFLLQKASVMGFSRNCSNIPNEDPKILASRIAVDKHNRRSSVTQEQCNPTRYDVKEIFCSHISLNTKKIGMKKTELDIFLNPTGEKSSLKVLDLEGVYKPILPKNLGKVLLNLRYLGLRWTVLSELPKSVCHLPCLETLDVKHTNITKIPRSIWTKKSLRHLYLNEVSFNHKSIPHRCLSKPRKLLESLQTLCGLNIEGNSPLLDVLSKLTGIEKLSLTCPSSLVEPVINRMSSVTTLQTLRLKSKDVLGQPSKLSLQGMNDLMSVSNLYLFGILQFQDSNLSIFPEKLKSLTLSMSFLTTNPMIQLGKLQHLTDLRLYGHSYHGETLTFSYQKFPELRTLKVWKLDKLETLKVEEEAMPYLEELHIRDCQKLTEICILGNRKALKEISLAKVKKELAESLERSLGQFIIITTQLIPSETTKEELPAK